MNHESTVASFQQLSLRFLRRWEVRLMQIGHHHDTRHLRNRLAQFDALPNAHIEDLDGPLGQHDPWETTLNGGSWEHHQTQWGIFQQTIFDCRSFSVITMQSLGMEICG